MEQNKANNDSGAHYFKEPKKVRRFFFFTLFISNDVDCENRAKMPTRAGTEER